MLRKLQTISLIAIALALTAVDARADRPSSIEILPDWTVGLIRVPDATEFRAKMGKTGLAEMLADEEVKPFVQSLYGSVTELLIELEQHLGMTVDQILEIPQGEILVAMVAPPALEPAPVVLLDLGDQADRANDLLEEGRRGLKKDGFSATTKDYEGVELEIFNKRDDFVIRFERENTLVLTTSMRAAERMVDAWIGKKKVKTLADNNTFSTILTRCQQGEGESDLMWFVDPIPLIRSVTRGNVAVATGMAILPALGLDGLKGLGGTMFLPEKEFEAITHFHLHLENPRDGVLELITLKQGDSLPEVWVPDDVTTYITGNVDIQKSFSIIKDLHDSFREEGQLSRLIKNEISNRLGIDFEQNFIAELQGRVTMLQWYERPPRLNSQSTLLAMKLHDVGRFRPHFKTVMDKFEQSLENKSFAGIPVYNIPGPDEADLKIDADEEDVDEDDEDARRRRRRARRRQARLQRMPRPAFALIDDYLVIADRRSFVEKIIDTKNKSDESLRNSVDYQRIVTKLREQPNGRTASMITFSQPAEALRMWYEFAQSESARAFMKEQREQNPVIRAVDDAMSKNPLPPFSKLERYFAPTGGIVTDEETGIHSMGFSLRPKLDDAKK